ncbi:hypothetical protein GSG79_004269 [Escherichia coli]|nr:hypothetical protein [Escherichia coli]
MATAITAAQIKDILNRAGDRSGFAFDKFGPYFANVERLKAMKAKFSDLVEMNAARIPERTRTAINNWFAFLADRYGI